MAKVGSAAPEWSCDAIVAGEIQRLDSAQLAGKWYLIYWYPLDFTFICPTEIREFERLKPEFDADNVVVLGASTDSVHSHKAWFGDRQVFPAAITHPVLGDTSHAISRAFGVLDEALGTAYRATVIVDNQGIVRSIGINDVQVGRSPAEVLRTVQALLSGGLCGADWRQGDRFAA
jgi:peroxiredoxin (alkyl hydroperoxide reductase subunit C)